MIKETLNEFILEGVTNLENLVLIDSIMDKELIFEKDYSLLITN